MGRYLRERIPPGVDRGPPRAGHRPLAACPSPGQTWVKLVAEAPSRKPVSARRNEPFLLQVGPGDECACAWTRPFCLPPAPAILSGATTPWGLGSPSSAPHRPHPRAPDRRAGWAFLIPAALRKPRARGRLSTPRRPRPRFGRALSERGASAGERKQSEGVCDESAGAGRLGRGRWWPALRSDGHGQAGEAGGRVSRARPEGDARVSPQVGK